MDKLDYPQRIAIELTPLCNLSCVMCPRHYISDTDGFMTDELWFKLIDDISLNSPETVVLPFWRGESLLHPQFCCLLDYALSKSVRIHISTNGLLVEGEIADILTRCEFVNFSVHTPEGLKRAKAFSDLLRSKDEKVTTLQISFVTGEYTTKYLYNLVAASDLAGFDSIRLYEEHTKNGVFGSIGTTIQAVRTYCPKLVDTLVIAYNGRLSRCSYIWNTEHGPNVYHMSVKEAWESEVMENIRKHYPDKQCESCDQWIGRTLGISWTKEEGQVWKNDIRP